MGSIKAARAAETTQECRRMAPSTRTVGAAPRIRARVVTCASLAAQVRGLNKNALPFLVGTKYDLFAAMERGEQEVGGCLVVTRPRE
jgi:hypothetical protein